MKNMKAITTLRDSLKMKDRELLSKRINEYISTQKCKSAWMGGGSFANVYSFSNGRVARLEFAKEGAGDEFSGYQSWVEKVVLNSRSKHVPKVFHHSRVVLKDSIEIDEYSDGNTVSCSGVMVTVMEVLSPIDEGDINIGSLTDHLAGYTYPIWPTPKKGVISKKSIKTLADRAKSVGVRVTDLHSGNIMRRKSDNRIVVTDPCY